MLAMALVVRKTVDTTSGAVAALLLVLFSKAFIDYCTSGLENPLSYLLASIFCYVLFIRKESPRYFLWLCLSASLAVVNRLDTILFYLPALIVVGLSYPWKKAARSALIGFSPLLVWEVFSLIYYGFPFPNTYYAKLNTGLPSGELIHQGFMYVLDTIGRDPFTVIVIATTLIWVAAKGTRLSKSLAVGVVCYLLYVVYIGGDFMAGRYFSVPLLICTILLAKSLPSGQGLQRIALPVIVVFVGMLSPHPPVLSDESFGTGPEKDINQRGIADERGFYFQHTGLIRVSRDWWAPMSTLDSASSQEGLSVIEVECAGLIGYSMGPEFHVIDCLALCDPLLARLPSDQHGRWRVGHYFRDLPVGYRATLESGQNQFAEEQLGQYYEHLRTITSDEVWSWKRFGTIWKMNLGRYDELIVEELSPPPETVNYDDISTPVPPGSHWKSEGTHVFHISGIVIELNRMRHDSLVELSSDHNDYYRLEFYRAGNEVEEITVERKRAAGIRWDTVSVSREACKEGYDRIRISPERGDGLYSVGHIRLLSDGDATDLPSAETTDSPKS